MLQLGDSQEAAKDLLALLGMVNQAVGDALSGILLVEAALRRRQWGLNDWAQLYTDLPSRQLKASSTGRETWLELSRSCEHATRLHGDLLLMT